MSRLDFDKQAHVSSGRHNHLAQLSGGAAAQFGVGDNSCTLYDVETGSTVTAPSPYRVVNYSTATKQLAIITRTVTATASYPIGFASYASNYLISGLTSLTQSQFVNSYGLDATTAASLAPLIARAFSAHCAGDEKLSDATTIATLNAMLGSSTATVKALGQSVYSLWTDTGPADNSVSLTLQ